MTQSIWCQNAIRWITMNEASQQNKLTHKKIYIDVYTDWCGWCKVMDRETFKDPYIVDFMNKNYISVKFNAESKDDIVFKNRVFSYIKTSGYHEFAGAIMRGKLSYPTSVFLDEELNLIQPLPGYLKPEDFEKVMIYFAKDKYKDTPWPKFQRSYVSPVSKRN